METVPCAPRAAPIGERMCLPSNEYLSYGTHDSQNFVPPTKENAKAYPRFWEPTVHTVCLPPLEHNSTTPPIGHLGPSYDAPSPPEATSSTSSLLFISNARPSRPHLVATNFLPQKRTSSPQRFVHNNPTTSSQPTPKHLDCKLLIEHIVYERL